MSFRQKIKIITLCVFLSLLGIGAGIYILAATGPASAAPTVNLIAHWRLDEGSGDFIADSSGNGHHGTAVDTIWTDAVDVTLLDPNALQFNGSSSYVDTADFDINDDFTLSAWIKPNKNDDSAILMKHDNSGGNLIMLGLYSGQYFFRIRDEFFYGPDVHTGEWIHLALTAYKEVAGPTNIERVSLYLNGTFIEQFAMLTEIGDVSGGRAWTIGQDWDGDTRTDFFDGAIDDVRIYDGEMLPSEIKALSEDHPALCRIYPAAAPDLNFAAGSGVCDEVILTAGEYDAANIEPTADVIIKGDDQALTTYVNISGTGSKRFMSNSLYTVTLQDLTIRNGYILASGLGGALYNQGTMTLTNVVLTNNNSDGDGGAVYNAGRLTLEDVVIDNNTGDNGGGLTNGALGHVTINNAHIWGNFGNGGGGVLNTGFLTLTHSLIEGNDSLASGGGILNYGTLMVAHTEISNNSAVGQGGGLYNDDFSSFVGTATLRTSQILTNTANAGGGITNAGTLTLDQSTVSGNTAQTTGGGINNSALANWIDINASTISANDAGGVGAGLASEAGAWLINSTISGNQRTNPGDGAGIYSTAGMTLTHVTISNNSSTGSGFTNGLLTFGGTLDVHNSLLVDNGSGSVNCAITGTTVTQAGNLSDDDSCMGFGEEGSLVLMPLFENGGLTPTHALPTNSLARDAADPANCLATDQRGVPRGNPCDVGAFEYGALNLAYLPTVVK